MLAFVAAYRFGHMELFGSAIYLLADAPTATRGTCAKPLHLLPISTLGAT